MVTRKKIIPLLSIAALAAMACVGVGWLADQHAHVSTSDARVRAHMVSVSADIAGRIAELSISPGDRIARGDVLARLDHRRAKLALAEASLDLKALEIAIARLRLEADISRARGGSRIDAALSGLDVAQADIAAAQASLAAAQADHARKQALHASGLLADAAMDRASEALELAQLGEVRSLTLKAGREAGLAEAHADATAARLPEQDAEQLAMEAAALRQRIASLRLDLEHHAIESPIDGVVDEVFAEAGEHVQPGARIALAHATTGLWIEANIKETDIGRVAEGADVEIRLDAAPAACSGQVERIGAATTSEFALVANANPAGVFTKITQRVPVRIRIGGACEQVRPGAMANLRIKAG